jgi:hypothetical protein
MGLAWATNPAFDAVPLEGAGADAVAVTAIEADGEEVTDWVSEAVGEGDPVVPDPDVVLVQQVSTTAAAATQIAIGRDTSPSLLESGTSLMADR